MTPEITSPLAATLQARTMPAVVLFGGEWNPGTRALRAFLTASGLPGNADLIDVDIDADAAAPAFAGVRCIPTVQVWKGGQKVAAKELAVAGDDLIGWLKSSI